MKLPVVPPPQDDAPWYADGLQFGCTQCGNCCTGPPGYVWLSDVEVERFSAHLKIDAVTFVKTYCRRIGNGLSLKERKSPAGEYDCIFLKEITPPGGGPSRRVCGVYDVRPLQCRTWPFWDGLLASREDWDAAKPRCPGLDRGRHYTQEQIEALRDAADWPTGKVPGSV
jgi:hypothetical protein